jgi:hypothetical protein
MPAAEVAKFQAWREAAALLTPARWPPLDIAAKMEEGDLALSGALGWWATWFAALEATCAPGADGAAAPAAAEAAAAAAEAVSGGARAAAALAAALLPLLTL